MKTYGTVSYNSKRDCFVIDCEAHVAIRLKRIFTRLKSSYGTLFLSAIPDNALDLEWFIGRYPLEVACQERLTYLAAKHREQIALVDLLLAQRGNPPQINLAIPLRDYQKIAAGLVLASGRLLLADDVGLGKTASWIGTLSDPRTLPALVVTLTHLPLQWKKEIERFAPGLKVHVIKQGKPYDIASSGRRKSAQLELEAFPDVVIINYHKLSGWAETLAPLIKSVVFDECQELRKSDSFKYKAAKHLSDAAQFRTGLSATPIYNHGGEMYSVLECIAPGALGTRNEFTSEWCAYQEKIKAPAAFGAYLRESGLMLRRTRQDVGRELPGLSAVPYAVEADLSALDKVSVSCSELARIILAQGEAYRGEKMHVSEELSNKLRQATGIAKAPYVAEFVRLLLEAGEKVVLYGWHREVYSIWLDRLKDLNPKLYTGSESPAQKEAAKQAFVEGDCRVLMISLRAGAGLDGLQKVCRTVVFGELDWSPGVHEQCSGRIYRDGQEDPVLAYFLISDSGSDPIMADVLGLKRQQIEGIRDERADMIEQLQTDGGHIRRLAEDFLKSHSVKGAESEIAA